MKEAGEIERIGFLCENDDCPIREVAIFLGIGTNAENDPNWHGGTVFASGRQTCPVCGVEMKQKNGFDHWRQP